MSREVESIENLIADINEDIGKAVHAYFEDQFTTLMSERPTRW